MRPDRSFSPAHWAAPLVALLVLVRCGGDDLNLPSEADPAELALVDGNNQRGAAGELLEQPLVVLVKDRRGQPVEQQRVAFRLGSEAPGAVLDPDTAMTAADGKASARWTLGNTSGPQTVVANVVGADRLEVTFQATVGAGGAARMEPAGGDDQVGAVGTALDDSLVVRVLDRFGNPASGVEVAWDAGGGSVDPTSVITGSDGRAATYRILGTSVGRQTATASSVGLDGSPVTFNSTAVPGSASELVRVSGDHQTGRPGAQLSAPLVVRLVDARGNGVPNRAVSWVVGAGGGSVDPLDGTTSDNGESTTKWTLGSADTNTANAVVSGVGVVAFMAIAQSGGGGGGGGDGGGNGGNPQPSRLSFRVQPSDTREDRKISPAVEVVVLDGSGNRFTTRDIEVKLELSGDNDSRLRGDLSKRTKSGVATFSDLRVDRPGDYELRASANGLPTVRSERFQVENGHHGGDHD
jgi:hypothetical protein